jgi:cysteine protease ATG4
MGVSEGKQLGDWLGPNTMGQVLKKLLIYDDWSRLVVHVAMDNVRSGKKGRWTPRELRT